MSGSAVVNRKARYWVVGLGVLTLLVLALVFGRTAREQFHIWRLGSEDLAASQRAASTLASMGSSRGFPYIVIVVHSRDSWSVHLESHGDCPQEILPSDSSQRGGS